ncbi:MAG TPA: methyltransferase [Paracoccaceae bacterium]|nr:methyltransferase [Paracoccaceae bacterium]
MRSARFDLALESGLSLPSAGDVLVFGAAAGDDLPALVRERVTVVQANRPDHDALAARGWRVVPRLVPGTRAAAALVCLPRARDAARDRIAQAAAAVLPGGPVIVDGQKTDGVDAALRELRGRVDLSEAVSKAHGKIAWFPAGPDLGDWIAAPQVVAGGFVTRAGVFSADGPDGGSALLAAALPARMPGRGVDLGAGWGYLARAALAREGVAHLDLVEADAEALDCARVNVTDPRAAFHWADATVWRPARIADWVICNPPFHAGRAADPALGMAFITAAARMLAPHGVLWLVANRPLPYDRILPQMFREIEDLGGDARFRLTRAARPLRSKS